MPEVQIRAAEDTELTPREAEFTQQIATLFEGLVGRGVLEVSPVEDEVRGNLQDVFELANRTKNLLWEDPGFVEEVVLPVAKNWNEMNGVPVGKVIGFWGTEFHISRGEESSDESPVYNLRLAGID